ncbi:similar to Saccharomyces cerevisiae YER163C GCG1 Putative protein of unknown function [Maudiozyma saulgeensis]|uniref:glutathione-specific gamma-glutamylcyclotransferase n=1 Tax=Maudiozyma saulgeensis TaxID=1789683 RepID=A0A1X7R7L8_9SACH|nr:similar to Saccharomyces cerevisiae YER163C GCG1 Putative protein of unknown function [Kazachstania saulgeensis]
MTVDKGLWILGYGSLIYKPPPHFTHRIPAIIHGFERRFWQSSIDHRGTPEAPGRVATLIAYEDIIARDEFKEDFHLYESKDPTAISRDDLTTVGVVYYIPSDHAADVREYLDIREQNGYTSHEVDVHLEVSSSQEAELKDSLSHLDIHEPSGRKVLRTSVYIGTVDNEAFVGPEDIKATAGVIATSHGPSGSNYKYLKLLCDSLDEMVKDGSMKATDNYLKKLLEEVHKGL